MNVFFFAKDICRILFETAVLEVCITLEGSLLNSTTILFDKKTLQLSKIEIGVVYYYARVHYFIHLWYTHCKINFESCYHDGLMLLLAEYAQNSKVPMDIDT